MSTRFHFDSPPTAILHSNDLVHNPADVCLGSSAGGPHGILVSRAIVEGRGKVDREAKYTEAQRQRLLRRGVREFFRLVGRPLLTMGDCGAFSYVSEPTPPVTVDEVIHLLRRVQLRLGRLG